MKRAILTILAFLLLATISYAGEVPKSVTLPIINQADQVTVRIEIYDINVEDKTIWCRLYDADDNMIEDKRVYAYEGSYKNIPAVLFESEIEYLDGKQPADSWYIGTIKLWMKDRQTKDEGGNVSIEDPYYYKGDATKEELLNQIAGLEK